MIELKRVTKVFHKGNANEFVALDDISLTIDAQHGYGFERPQRIREDNAPEHHRRHDKTNDGRVEILGR